MAALPQSRGELAQILAGLPEESNWRTQQRGINRLLELINRYHNQYLSGQQQDAFDAFSHITTALIDEFGSDGAAKPPHEVKQQPAKAPDNLMSKLLRSTQVTTFTFALRLTL
jgi:hypothetical protein